MLLPLKLTIEQAYGPAMQITEEDNAREYFDALVARRVECDGLSREEAERIERVNLGYFAGYYDNETRARVEKLFRCEHPVFGAIAVRGPSTANEALVAGLLAAVTGKLGS